MAPAPILLLAILTALTFGVIIALVMLGRRHPAIAVSVFLGLCAMAGLVLLAGFYTTGRSASMAEVARAHALAQSSVGTRSFTVDVPPPPSEPPGIPVGDGQIVFELPESAALRGDIAELIDKPLSVIGDRISVVGRAIHLPRPGQSLPPEESEARRRTDERLREARQSDAKRRLIEALHDLRYSRWSKLRELGTRLSRLDSRDFSELAQLLLDRNASIVADKRCTVAIRGNQLAEVCVLQADFDPSDISQVLSGFEQPGLGEHVSARAKALSVPIGIAILIIAYWFLKRSTHRTGASHKPPSAGCC